MVSPQESFDSAVKAAGPTLKHLDTLQLETRSETELRDILWHLEAIEMAIRYELTMKATDDGGPVDLA